MSTLMPPLVLCSLGTINKTKVNSEKLTNKTFQQRLRVYLIVFAFANLFTVTSCKNSQFVRPLPDNFPKPIFPKISANIMINYDNSAQSFRENGPLRPV